MELTLPAEGRSEGDVVPVKLRSQITEVGTLLLEAEPTRPLKDGERWQYKPPANHQVAWVANSSGLLNVHGVTLDKEIAIFEESNLPITFLAQGDTEFVLGSSVKHPHALVTGYYSVHTSAEALKE